MNVELFKTKLSLLVMQEEEGLFCHFPLLGKEKVLSSVSWKFKGHLSSLENEMSDKKISGQTEA